MASMPICVPASRPGTDLCAGIMQTGVGTGLAAASQDVAGQGRPPKPIRRDAEHHPISVKALARGLPARAWRTIKWREGTAVRLSSRFARVRVRVAHRDYWLTEPRPEEWLLIEWPPGESEPTKYWLSTLPDNITFPRVVDLAKLRWRIERDYQDLKQEVGLGHFEGRGWRGFHHHATLCIAAYGFPDLRTGDDSPLASIFPQRLGRARSLSPPALSDNYQPRGSVAACRTAHPKLDCNDASTADRRHRRRLPRCPCCAAPMARHAESLMTQ